MTQKFIVERQEDDVVITIPMISAIITVMVTIPPHHHPLACDVLANMAAVITNEDIDQHGGETVEEVKKAIAFFQAEHPITSESRFFVDEERYVIGEMHPAELWAIRSSLEHLQGILPEPGAMAQTIETWMAAGELVTAMERFAVAPESGTVVQ